MPAGGGTSQTAVNRLAGARTPAGGDGHGRAHADDDALARAAIGLMPQATLAAVVIVYSIGLIQPAEFRAIRNVRRTEFVWALAALAGVVLLGTLQGILVAIIVSLVALAHQVADPPVHVLARKRGTNVFRPRSARAPRRRDVPRSADAADRGTPLLRERASASARRSGRWSRRRSRASSCSTCAACSISSTRRSRC